jgi:hypothetical protein
MNRITKSRNPQGKKVQSQYISANKKIKKPNEMADEGTGAQMNQTVKNPMNFLFGNLNSNNTNKLYNVQGDAGGLEITNPFDTNQMQ